MVKAFKFARLPEIVFRNGSIAGLPDLIKKYGGSVLLVTGKSSFITSEKGKDLLRAMEGLKIPFNLVHITTEPAPAMIDDAVDTFRGMDPSLVVGIGGGSVLDAAKAISAMMTVEGPVKEYLEGVGTREHPGTKLPFIAIPTTSGTGSEATKNAVISEVGPEGFKKSLRHDHFVPDIALLDPELTLDCPRDITAASGMDCFTQLTEAFLSEKASAYTDAFAREGLRAIKSSLVRVCKDGSDLEARTGMSFAALNSGICLANAGLGTVHGFASSVGGRLEIPHGLVCGTLMAVINRINVRELGKENRDSRALRKYAELGRLFLDVENKSDNFYIDGFIDYLYSLNSELGIPGLGSYGLEEKHITDIIAATDNKNNPIKLGPEEMEEAIRERMGNQ